MNPLAALKWLSVRALAPKISPQPGWVYADTFLVPDGTEDRYWPGLPGVVHVPLLCTGLRDTFSTLRNALASDREYLWLEHYASMREAMGGSLIRYAAQRMPRPRLVLDWWEGQPCDDALALAFPNVPIKRVYSGLQAGDMPADVHVVGRDLSWGVHPVAPAFRYQWVHRPLPIREKSLQKTVVVAMPIDPRPVLGMIEQAAGMVPALFRIKWHPATSRRVHHNIRCRATTRPMPELIDAADVVVCGASSVALEAICRGVPVVLIGEEAFHARRPLSIPAHWWPVVNTGDALVSWLSLRLKHGLEAWQKHGPKRADGIFEPVTAAGIERFLKGGARWKRIK